VVPELRAQSDLLGLQSGRSGGCASVVASRRSKTLGRRKPIGGTAVTDEAQLVTQGRKEHTPAAAAYGVVPADALRVIVRWVPGGWQASTEQQVIARSRNLVALDRKVQRLNEGRAVAYQFHTGNVELDQLSRRIRGMRALVGRYSQMLPQLTEQAIMAAPGLSERDLGFLTGVSHQRIHQLIEQWRTAVPEEEDTDVRGDATG
jgi:hypothetical protein